MPAIPHNTCITRPSVEDAFRDASWRERKLLFYATGLFRKVEAMGPGDDAPVGAKVVAAASLILWAGVMYMGRMLPYIGNAF